MSYNFVARSSLYVRKIAGGNFITNDESKGTGNVYWVSSTSSTKADSVGAGFSPDAPFATLAFALTQCTSGQGDRIYCMEGHAEAVIAAGTIAWTKTAVTVIGVGEGTLRPTFSWTTILSATMTMAAAGCRISNCIFDVSGITALTSGIVISAAGNKIDNCTFITSAAGAGTAPLQSILTTAAANYLTIADNQFLGPALTPTTVAAATSCITLVGGTGIRITGNMMTPWCTTTTGPISCITTLTNNVQITRNYIFNQTASSAKAISLLTGSTGMISDNRLQVLTGSTPIAGDGCTFLNNYYAATIATLGTIL